ncbi:tetratricopeptide repeat protein [Thiocapsa marina]|uniref:Tetratricopeptide TPR_1 repeat-containing protein n=1 Tax=Thiocapsa marina 5811 TaxID=768671 RepID=F9UDL1_9GAMM|nr:tetratricopeptide repeat protein [Thiocapsa marina]EGV17658.1 Tetratricopeptide TPR_1 repeat-containing protein [Thiocapsa marina 5811]
MPRLSPLQWLLFAVFLFFYGFTVFAVTRDYYIRDAARPAVAAAAPHGLPTQTTPRPAPTAIPQTITETNPDLLAQQADALFVERRYTEAVPIYRRLLELRPGDVEAHNDLGLALHYMGDPDGALTQLRAGAAKDANHQRIWLTLGFVSLQAGDTVEARTALERARDLGADTGVGQEATRLLDLIEE